MNHLTDLQCSMHADEALDGIDADSMAGHLEACSRCQSRVAEFVYERRLIEAALNIEDLVSVPDIVAPKFTKPVRLRDFTVANVAPGLVIWLTQFLWKTLFGELVVNMFSRITLIDVPDVFGTLVNTALYFSQEGATTMDAYLALIALCLLTATLAWFAFSYRKGRASMSLCLTVAFAGCLISPPSATALEHRHGEGMVTIDANEIIDDTMIIVGDTLMIDGTINGDLIALGRRVIISGSVSGNLITIGESITVQGQIGGMVVGAASVLQLDNAVVGGDFWGAGGVVSIGRESRIDGNAAVATDAALIAGTIGRDLVAFAENIELSGHVGEDFEVFADSVSLFGDAKINGDLRFRTDDEERLQLSSTDMVGGEIEFLSSHTERQSRNRYMTGMFYLHQLLHLVSAFIAGFALLWFVPGLRDLTLAGGKAGLKSAGIGLVTFISLPIIMVLFAITVIGIPFAVISLFSWLLVIYASKIILASTIGQMMLSSTEKYDSLPLTLLAGLFVIYIATNLPAIGGIVNIILTIVGFGMIVQFVLSYASDLEAESDTE